MSSAGPWLHLVVHPQVPSICDSRRFVPWPEEGWLGMSPFSDAPAETLWPVPWLKNARLVDCGRCKKTGIQVCSWQDLTRYIPGSRVDEEGRLTLAPVLDPLQWPDGSGRDEETISDMAVERALAVLRDGGAILPREPARKISGYDGVPAAIRTQAAAQRAGEETTQAHYDLVRQVIKAALADPGAIREA